MQNCKKFNVLHGNDRKKYKEIFSMMLSCIEKTYQADSLKIQ